MTHNRVGGTTGRRALLQLLLIMAVVAAGAAITVGARLYAESFAQQRLRLIETADSRAHLIDAIAEYDKLHTEDGDPTEATLGQIRQAHQGFAGFGETGEFTLARRQGGDIVFLVAHRNSRLAAPAIVPYDSGLAAPMVRALAGEAGSMVGLDYRGVKVLAAYHPVASLGFGVVAKIDLAEIRAPFVRTGLVAAGICGLLVLVGARVFLRVGDPMVTRLVESERRFRTMVEQSPSITYINGIDEDWRTVYVSPTAESILGIRASDIADGTDPFLQRLHPDDRERVKAEALAGRASKGRYSSQYRILTDAGETVWVQDDAVVLLGAEGRPERVQGIIVDITQRKRVETALQEREGRLRAIVETAAEGVVLARVDGTILSWNSAAESMFGYSEAEVLGEPVTLLTPERDRDRHQRSLDSLDRRAATNRGWHRALDVVGRRKDGTEFPLTVSLGAFEQAGETFLTGLLHDLTERRHWEEDLSRLATAIDQVSEAVMITDPAGEIQFVNPAFEKITGYSTEEVLGQTPPLLKSSTHDEAFYRDLWGTLLRGETWHGRFKNRRKDGTSYDDLSTITPVTDERGGVANYVVVKRDVTEQILLEESLRQAQKMEAVGQLAGGVAHDFNNLLTGIAGYSELVLSEVDSDTRMAGDLRGVLELVSRASDLTRQLSLFSRRETFGFQVLELNKLVASATKMLGRMVGETIEIETLVGADVGNVRGDSGQIEQVLMNLVINARDAMPSGGDLRIETSVVDGSTDEVLLGLEMGGGEFALLSVADTGHGMDDQTQEHIFEPFFTTKEPGKGTGLGLATAYGIVREHGGAITVESAPDAGTTFRVYLPQVAASVVDAGAADSPPLIGGSETILVVEDQAEVRELLQRQLSACGYQVLLAAHPEDAEALHASHRSDIALLLTDVVLPGFAGTVLYRKLLASDPNLKVMFISGYSDQVDEIGRVLASGGGFLRKPFTRQQLVSQVRRALDR